MWLACVCRSKIVGGSPCIAGDACGVRRRGGENVITAAPVALPAPEAKSPEATPEPKQKH
jgi:hypothetical protein